MDSRERAIKEIERINSMLAAKRVEGLQAAEEKLYTACEKSLRSGSPEWLGVYMGREVYISVKEAEK